MAMNPSESQASDGLIASLLPSSLRENPYFSAGFGLMLFGAALGVARKSLTVGTSAAQRRMLVSLEITSKDRAYPWFLYWMGKQAEAASMRQAGLLPHMQRESFTQLAGISRPPVYDVKRKGKAPIRGDEAGVEDPLALSDDETLQPVRIFSHELSVETSAVQDQLGKQQRGGTTIFSLVPGPGTHWFRYQGTWVRVRAGVFQHGPAAILIGPCHFSLISDATREG